MATATKTKTLAWHFLREDKCLGYNDGRKVRKGQTLRHEGTPVMCQSGLHASIRAIDALHYSPGKMLTSMLMKLET